VQTSTDGNESDNDATGDLEELERRMDAGESFEDELLSLLTSGTIVVSRMIN
jgi:hypothetical protein